MNAVLITGDDGPDATGLEILREAVQKVWPARKQVVIVPSTHYSGISMGLTPGPFLNFMEAPMEQFDTDCFKVPLTPADIIYRAFYEQDKYAGRDWGLVLVGVNHGANLGFDVYHSGTVGAAMVAATAFKCPAFAFSQGMPLADVAKSVGGDSKSDRDLFATAERLVPDFLRKQTPTDGVAYNVNFPPVSTMGYRDSPTAHYSYYRSPPTKLVPRAREERSDITAFDQGFVSVSQLSLRVNTPLRF